MAVNSYLQDETEGTAPVSSAPANSYLSATSAPAAAVMPGNSLMGGSSLNIHLLSNQNIDPGIAALFKDIISEQNGQKYYTGATDPSLYQYGTQGLQTQDIGGGKYNILGSNGNVLGVGYYDPSTAIMKTAMERELGKIQETANSLYNPNYAPNPRLKGPLARLQSAIDPRQYTAQNYYTSPLFMNNTQVTGDDGTISNVATPQNFYSKEDLEAAIRQKFDQLGAPKYENELAAWEALGQMLDPHESTLRGGKRIIDSLSRTKMGGGLYPSIHRWGNLPGNNYAETISGLNTLYGSTPLMYMGEDPRLIGYKMNLGPGQTIDRKHGEYVTKGNPFVYYNQHDGKSHAYATSVGRELLNPEMYKDLVSGLGDYNVLVTPENAAKLPGWQNKDQYKHIDKEYLGYDSGLASLLGAALSFTPLAPLGMAITAANSMANNNPIGAIAPMLGAAGVFDKLSGTIGGGLGLSGKLGSAVGNAVVQGGLGGLGSAMMGGNFGKGALSGALGSLAGSGAGNLLSGAGSVLQSAGSSLANNAVRQLINNGRADPRTLLASAVQSGAGKLFRS